MKEIPKQELVDIFEPQDGTVNMYYGRIGNGKTYNATADILTDLSRGHVVYANWIIKWDGFDERQHPLIVFLKVLFFRSKFFKFNKENLKYFSPDDVDIDFLSGLTDCDVYIDEGQWIMDSYEGTKFSKAKRKLILHTRHFNRSLNIISQRTQAIQKTARGQVNRFYKCEKVLSWPFLIFRRTEFQDMVGDDVDETSKPVSKKLYFASKKVMNAYNSKYMRSGVPKSQDVNFEAYKFKFFERLRLLFSFFRSRKRINALSGGKNFLDVDLKTKEERLGIRSIKKSLGGQIPESDVKEAGEAKYGTAPLDQVSLPF